MPVVAHETKPAELQIPKSPLFSRCGNPRCATGWMRLWRSRRVPLFEGRWACSAKCMGEQVAAAVRRELQQGDSGGGYRHRMPLGLLLVGQGQMTPERLREALAQRAASELADRPLGEWLVQSGLLTETLLTRALSAQWNCPVFSTNGYRAELVAALLPRFFSLALDAVPLRVAAGGALILAFAGRVDRSLAYALEAMTGMRVTSGMAPESEFREAQSRYLAAGAPRTRLLEAPSAWALAEALARRIEEEKPVEAKLRRVHGWFWLRMWKHAPGVESRAGIEDVVATLGGALL